MTEMPPPPAPPSDESTSVPTREPIAVTEVARSAIIALFGFVAAFGIWSPTPEQTGAVLGLLVPLSLGLSWWARTKSTPNVRVALTQRDSELLEMQAETQRNAVRQTGRAVLGVPVEPD